ncbi:MAG: hypothetical protein ACRC9T_05575 [Vibrionaceae bacterium]
MSSSDQAANTSSLRTFTVPQLRELLEGRLDGQNEGNLRNLVVSLRNSDEQPLTQGRVGDAGASTSRAASMTAVREALIVQRRALIRADSAAVASAAPHQPIEAQLVAVQTLLHRHTMLLLVEEELKDTELSLQNFNIRYQHVTQTDKIKEMRCTREHDLSMAKRSVDREREGLRAAEENASRLFGVNLSQSGTPLSQAATAVETRLDDTVATSTLVDLSSPPLSASGQPISRLVRREAIPIVPRSLTPVDGSTGSSVREALDLLRSQYRAFSAAVHRVETAEEGGRRLNVVQNRAAAAASQCQTSPISQPVRDALFRVDEQLNTQNTLPGSHESRHNLMLHLHNVMNHQLLTEIPIDATRLKSFVSFSNAESGLSNISLVQILTAVLRASPNEVIRAQIEEILVSHTVCAVPLVRLLDRTHGRFMPPEQALALLESSIPAMVNRRMRAFTYSVLEICRLALSELQMQQRALQPSVGDMSAQTQMLLSTLNSLRSALAAEDGGSSQAASSVQATTSAQEASSISQSTQAASSNEDEPSRR